MTIHDATEQSYKNGYEKGLKDAEKKLNKVRFPLEINCKYPETCLHKNECENDKCYFQEIDCEDVFNYKDTMFCPLAKTIQVSITCNADDKGYQDIYTIDVPKSQLNDLLSLFVSGKRLPQSIKDVLFEKFKSESYLLKDNFDNEFFGMWMETIRRVIDEFE